MRALVTGAGGFVGQWLSRALLAAHWEVTGLTPDEAPATPVLSAGERAAVRWRRADIRDGTALDAALDAARPDAIFHLAGISFLPGAAADPGLACEVNVVGAARLLGAVRERKRAGTLDPAVVVAGSGEQYGRHDAGALPLREDAAQRPRTVYAASKAAQEVIALEAHRSDGVRVVAARSFNHSGAGQHPPFLLPSLVARVLERRAAAAAGAPPAPVPIGNTSTIRDYLHVNDVVRAYLALAERGQAGEAYNVCSGVGLSVGEVAERVLRRCGVSLPLQVSDALVRPAEVPAMIGDHGKLREATGWAPVHSFDDILDDLIHAATH